jgi:hypothetical protein
LAVARLGFGRKTEKPAEQCEPEQQRFYQHAYLLGWLLKLLPAVSVAHCG